MRRAVVESIEESEEVERRGAVGTRWRVPVMGAMGSSAVEPTGPWDGGCVVKGMFEVVEDEDDGVKRNCWGLMSYLHDIGKRSYFGAMFRDTGALRASRCDVRSLDRVNKTGLTLGK